MKNSAVSLNIQIHTDKVSEGDLVKAVALCRELACDKEIFEKLRFVEGEDNGRYTNIIFNTKNVRKLWRKLKDCLYNNPNIGRSLQSASIAACEGLHGWDDYLLLYHYDKAEILDDFPSPDVNN